MQRSAKRLAIFSSKVGMWVQIETIRRSRVAFYAECDERDDGCSMHRTSENHGFAQRYLYRYLRAST